HRLVALDPLVRLGHPAAHKGAQETSPTRQLAIFPGPAAVRWPPVCMTPCPGRSACNTLADQLKVKKQSKKGTDHNFYERGLSLFLFYFLARRK
ncbi:MAG: hypothetical protein ACO1NO_07700, partial [Burkholderiaceae bacterium]